MPQDDLTGALGWSMACCFVYGIEKSEASQPQLGNGEGHSSPQLSWIRPDQNPQLNLVNRSPLSIVLDDVPQSMIDTMIVGLVIRDCW